MPRRMFSHKKTIDHLIIHAYNQLSYYLIFDVHTFLTNDW